MLRIKLPSGQVSPAQLRAIGEVSQQFGRGDAELATRQNIQLHWLELSSLPDVFAALDAAGLSTAGGCGDTVRNITGCPVQGLAHDELFDASARGRGGGGVLLRQSGLHRSPAQAQDHDLRLRARVQRAGDQLHRPRGRHRGRARGFLRARRRRALLGAADLARHGRLRPARAGGHGARGHPRRLEDGSALPGLAGQGAAEVHGRRHRPRGDARARRGSPGLPPGGLRARGAPDAQSTISASIRRSRRGTPTSASPCTSASSAPTSSSPSGTWRRRSAPTCASRAARTSSSPASPTNGSTTRSRAWRRSASR